MRIGGLAGHSGGLFGGGDTSDWSGPAEASDIRDKAARGDHLEGWLPLAVSSSSRAIGLPVGLEYVC